MKPLFRANTTTKSRNKFWQSLVGAFSYAWVAWVLFCFGLWIPSSSAGFQQIGSWGFDQGGGFRQGNFVGEDADLILVDMAWNPEGKQLAVAGELAGNWAVRVYSFSSEGPDLLVSWDGNASLHASVATALVWVPSSGKLVCGVEHLINDRISVSIFGLDVESKEVERVEDFSGWDSLIELKHESTEKNVAWALGTEEGLAKVAEVNLSRMQIVDEFRMEKIQEPVDMVFAHGKAWIGGHDESNALIEVFEEGTPLESISIGENIFLSKMVASKDQLFLTGRSKDKEEELEDFFLESRKLRLEDAESWRVLVKPDPKIKEGVGGSEVGTSLVALSDGSVLVGGHFREPWLLGERAKSSARDAKGKFAMLMPSGQGEQNFDSFLAHYDQDGDLIWAQSSDFYRK